MTADVVFLLDVDNTLLDGDRIVDDMRDHLKHEFGVNSAQRYWAIFDALRKEIDYVDYLGALQLYLTRKSPVPQSASRVDVETAPVL